MYFERTSFPFGIAITVAEAHLRALHKREKAAIYATVSAGLIGLLFIASELARWRGYLGGGAPDTANMFLIIAALAGLPIFVSGSFYAAREESLQRQRKEDKLEAIEAEVREHPDKPQLAWDLARTKLESYLDRNLSQVRSIYWLTLIVMVAGFGIIAYALVKAFSNPNTLPVAIVASASGVLISFIGGSFLVIYRSILAQSASYVSVLERINAVGMAVQVISTIPDSDGALKHSSTAELSRQLLGMYAGTSPLAAAHPTTRRTRPRSPKGSP